MDERAFRPWNDAAEEFFDGLFVRAHLIAQPPGQPLQSFPGLRFEMHPVQHRQECFPKQFIGLLLCPLSGLLFFVRPSGLLVFLRRLLRSFLLGLVVALLLVVLLVSLATVLGPLAFTGVVAGPAAWLLIVGLVSSRGMGLVAPSLFALSTLIRGVLVRSGSGSWGQFVVLQNGVNRLLESLLLVLALLSPFLGGSGTPSGSLVVAQFGTQRVVQFGWLIICRAFWRQRFARASWDRFLPFLLGLLEQSDRLFGTPAQNLSLFAPFGKEGRRRKPVAAVPPAAVGWPCSESTNELTTTTQFDFA